MKADFCGVSNRPGAHTSKCGRAYEEPPPDPWEAAPGEWEEMPPGEWSPEELAIFADMEKELLATPWEWEPWEWEPAPEILEPAPGEWEPWEW